MKKNLRVIPEIVSNCCQLIDQIKSIFVQVILDFVVHFVSLLEDFRSFEF